MHFMLSSAIVERDCWLDRSVIGVHRGFLGRDGRFGASRNRNYLVILPHSTLGLDCKHSLSRTVSPVFDMRYR